MNTNKNNNELEGAKEPLLNFLSDDVAITNATRVPKSKIKPTIPTIDEIVEMIINARKSHVVYNKSDIKKMILKIHNKDVSDLHIIKKYEDDDDEYIVDNDNNDNNKNNNKKILFENNYGVFKHKYFDLIIRIDTTRDQVENEMLTADVIFKKYNNNNFMEIFRMGIVLPMYVHIEVAPSSSLYYSIQPHVNGMTLDMWMHKHKSRGNIYEMMYDLLIQVCAIIKELHDVDCVHGDLKPNNIMVDYNNNVCLIDYGLSGTHLKTTHASGGTMPYCAPETGNVNQYITGINYSYKWVKHDKKHDIWSIGLIFMTMYAFKKTYNYYNEFPYLFFDEYGYINPRYFNSVKHEYLRDIFMKHMLVRPENRCSINELNPILADMAFM